MHSGDVIVGVKIGDDALGVDDCETPILPVGNTQGNGKVTVPMKIRPSFDLVVSFN